MRINKYFIQIIVLIGVLFFTFNSVEAACERYISGVSGNCCDNSLDQTSCLALPDGTRNWVNNCTYPACPTARTSITNPALTPNHASTVSPTTSATTMPGHVPDSGVATSSTATTFVNPIRFSSVSEVVGALLSNLRGIIATIAILFIVIGGVMYILSAGDEKMITKAKATITSAMIGLAIALAAPTFLLEIQRILGGSSATNSDALNGALTLKDIIMRTMNLLLSIAGILAMISLVVGGITYMGGFSTAIGSGDNKKNVETGKKIITNSLIGIAIVMAALVIVRQISSVMGVQ